MNCSLHRKCARELAERNRTAVYGFRKREKKNPYCSRLNDVDKRKTKKNHVQIKNICIVDEIELLMSLDGIIN